MSQGAANQGRKKALLVLFDGRVFEGTSFGAVPTGPVEGELVFNTSMTGYQQAITDPSYAGQLLTFTYPLVGNYGISEGAFESQKAHCRAVVVKEACAKPAHYASNGTLNEFLLQQGVVGIEGVDTRAIVGAIRSAGVMPAAVVSFEGEEGAKQAVAQALVKIGSFDYGKTDFVRQVASRKEIVFGSENGETVVVVDCGCKASIIREITAMGFRAVVVPPDSSAQKILSHKPRGVVYSNGPGDPALMQYAIRELAELVGKVPVFGICLGHQLLCHALGGRTFKLKFGHRGSNHPVREVGSGRVFITAQNHGFAAQLPPGAQEWFVNCNDGTNEGLAAEGKKAMSVQFHPEANPGPYDSRYLFGQFAEMMG